jgi:hypothetical protein
MSLRRWVVVALAAAVATGGASVLAQGLFDRFRGSQDLCKVSRDLALKK